MTQMKRLLGQTKSVNKGPVFSLGADLEVPRGFASRTIRYKVRELLTAAYGQIESPGPAESCADHVGFAMDVLNEVDMRGVLPGCSELGSGAC
ncbi:hypothetical protein G6O69_24925 [Pseudenhygromyxa sp. WMMC2535]|uniref:hypothetical protein n=1 Tax=Pseudenhygromyxa sp. WMMC2535 TaxID=2712867 RepID=UPI0015576D4F|nr:hypothetical protein [Pseudenhygromyxa sp. WMMC2535]NVB41107.1 hypothetical protein [Pseudenhygromyxa sp. WMMC2535]